MAGDGSSGVVEQIVDAQQDPGDGVDLAQPLDVLCHRKSDGPIGCIEMGVDIDVLDEADSDDAVT